MPTKSLVHSDPGQLARAVERQILERTSRRIRWLRVEVIGERVYVPGATPSYHVKQLVLLAVQEIIEATPVEIDVQVSTGEPCPAQGHQVS